MKEQPTRAFLNTDSCNQYAIRLGFQWLSMLHDEDPKKNRALIAGCTKRVLADFLACCFSDNVVRKFMRETTMMYDGIQLSILTEKSRMYEWKGPILAIAPTQKVLDAIDNLYFVTDVFVIPYTLNEIDCWIRTWNVLPYGSSPE